MTDQEKKDIIMVANFVGFTPCLVRNINGKKYDFNIPNGFTLIKEVETTIESNWCEVLEEQDYCFVEDLKFNSSWDWLMPVVKKIREVINTELNFSDFDDQRGYDQRLNPYNYDIDSIYKGAVEFIKWYNENKGE